MEEEKFYTLLTDIGKAKVANSIGFGTKINFTKMKVGDGDGAYYNPSEKQTELKNVVWEGAINHVEVDQDNPNYINVEVMLPANVGGFYIREYGAYDDEDNLIGICKCPESYKPKVTNGGAKELLLILTLCVVNTDAVELKIDPTIIFAKKQEIETLRTEVITQLNAMAYEVAGGTATAITLNMQTLKNGYWKKFIATKDNNGAATTVNGKPLYKVCSTNTPTLKANRPYEIYYNLTGDCFFLKASATGTATNAQVLAGATYSTENDTDLVGTMPNRGAPTVALNCGGTYNIPAGYYSGGKVTANSLASHLSSDTLELASQLLAGVKAHTKNGVQVTGTATIQSLGGCPVYTASIGIQYLSPGGSRDYYIDPYAFLRPHISESILEKYDYALVRLTGKVNGVSVDTATSYYGKTIGRTIGTQDYTTPGVSTVQIVGYGTVGDVTSSTIQVKVVLYNSL